jgi:hypothetical protein
LVPFRYTVIYPRVDATLTRGRLDGCRTIGYSQILILREIVHEIQMKSESEETPKISDRVSLIGGNGMGGYVYVI